MRLKAQTDTQTNRRHLQIGSDEPDVKCFKTSKPPDKWTRDYMPKTTTQYLQLNKSQEQDRHDVELWTDPLELKPEGLARDTYHHGRFYHKWKIQDPL